MKKITLLVVAMLFGSLTAFAQFSFPSVPGPTNVAAGTPVTLNINDVGNSAAGTSVVTGNVLTASTAYEVYVQTDCGVDGTSAYVTTGFTTTAGPPPANDNFANAQAIDCSTTNLMGSTSLATLDEDDAPDGGGADMDAPNVWFSYDSAAEGAGDITVDLCPSTYDTSVLVYTGTSGNLTFVAGNDDNIGVCGQCCQSNVTFVANGTDTYYIAVEGFNFGSTGDFDMTVSCVAPTPPPANDQCANAEALTLTVTATGTTVGATTDAGDPPTCDTFGQIADVWYSVNLTLSSNNLSIVTTITDTSDQANVAVYTDCDGAAGNSVGCSDANGGETLTINNLPAGLYYVRVWSDGNAPPSSGRTEGGFTVTADATLSTGSVEDANAFTYYPNPVKGELLLNAQKDIQDVTVFNVLGQQVLRVAPNNADTAIDMNGLSNGAYFVRVTIDNVTETVRIIKQ